MSSLISSLSVSLLTKVMRVFLKPNGCIKDEGMNSYVI